MLKAMLKLEGARVPANHALGAYGHLLGGQHTQHHAAPNPNQVLDHVSMRSALMLWDLKGSGLDHDQK